MKRRSVSRRAKAALVMTVALVMAPSAVLAAVSGKERSMAKEAGDINVDVDLRSLRRLIDSMELASWRAVQAARLSSMPHGPSAESMFGRMDRFASAAFSLHDEVDVGKTPPRKIRSEVLGLRKEAEEVGALLRKARWHPSTRGDWKKVVDVARATERFLTIPEGRQPARLAGAATPRGRPGETGKDAAAHDGESSDVYHPRYRAGPMTPTVRMDALRLSHELFQRAEHAAGLLPRSHDDDDALAQFVDRFDHFREETRAFHESLETDLVDVNSVDLAILHLRQDAGVLQRDVSTFGSETFSSEWRTLPDVLSRLSRLVP